MVNINILLVVAALLVLPAVFGEGCDKTSIIPEEYCPCCDDDAAVCSFTQPGSFKCICNSGFSGDGFNCTNINECADEDSNTCDSINTGGNCTDTPGSYICSCADGYNSRSGNGRRCDDIDECVKELHTCNTANSACHNLVGDYECECVSPFWERGNSNKICIDVNECKLNSSLCDYECVNTEGSYYCECPSGYTGDGITICNDIDECLGNPCNDNANCTNIDGGFTCKCEPGLSGDGFTCSEIDECTTGENECDKDSTYCVDTSRSYDCKCYLGYQNSNGTHCEAKKSQSTIDKTLKDLKRQKLLIQIRTALLEITRLETEQDHAILNCENKAELVKHNHRRRRRAIVENATDDQLEGELDRLQISLSNIQLQNRVIASRCKLITL